jgi:hypothetical protein
MFKTSCTTLQNVEKQGHTNKIVHQHVKPTLECNRINKDEDR